MNYEASAPTVSDSIITAHTCYPHAFERRDKQDVFVSFPHNFSPRPHIETFRAKDRLKPEVASLNFDTVSLRERVSRARGWC